MGQFANDKSIPRNRVDGFGRRGGFGFGVRIG